jgi:hypothetical protein
VEGEIFMTMDINKSNEIMSGDIPAQKNFAHILPHPWRRYFARGIDLALYGLIWTVFCHLVIRWNPGTFFINYIIFGYITCGLMLLLEPLLLSTWGTTPGKFVFGLRLRDINGEKIDFSMGFKRTFGVFSKGMGYNLPIYTLYTHIKCYQKCDNMDDLPWEEGFNYKLKDKKAIRIIGFFAVHIAVYALTFIIPLQAGMPIHRGNITAEQYYKNCNHIMSYSKIDFGKYFNKQGQWVDKSLEGSYYVGMNSLPLPDHVLTVSDGIVTGIRIEVETDVYEWITGYTSQKYIAVMSFLASQKEMNFIRLHRSGILQKIDNDYENYSFVEEGIRVTNKVEYSGYDFFGGQYLSPIQGEKQKFHMIFTLEKVEQ